MAKTTLKKLWENEYIKTAVTIALILVIIFGFWLIVQVVLSTPYPALAVASGSMCKVQRMHCDGWSHPFEPTLHIGDLIIIQGIDPENIKTALYPEHDFNGDIIVFRRPASNELIVHRAIAKEKRNGKWYFQTKGDGNIRPDSQVPNIPEDYVVGRVIMRVPWVGHIALFLHDSFGLWMIVFLIIALVIVEFITPLLSRKREVEHEEGLEMVSET